MKILVIDDDPAMTDLLVLLLKPTSSTIIAANSGEAGIDLIKRESPDAVLLDLMMPGMDGLQVCTAVRKFSRVPILVLSALDNPGMVASALDAGADDYLVKPVASSVLSAHISRLVNPRPLPVFSMAAVLGV